jgi:uncharacterized beta-barrel protein YwiB (DUF1934 family)
MLIKFEMIAENLNISYKVFGKKEGNVLTFLDKSVPNTTMHVTINPDSIVIERIGSVVMKQEFKLNEKIEGFYQNNMGLEFEIYSYTKEMVVTENSITILYEHYLSDNWQSSNKLKILF